MADYIERKAILDKAEYDENYRLVVPVDTVKSLPTADVAPVVHGKWILTVNEVASCSCCHSIVSWVWERTPYCPYCGAKMDGGADDAAD